MVRENIIGGQRRSVTARAGIVFALLVTILGLGIVTAAPAAAAPVQESRVGPLWACDWYPSTTGLTVHARCTPDSPGSQFRVWVTTCGPGSCQPSRPGPWWPQDYVWRHWTPGGYIASVDSFQFS